MNSKNSPTEPPSPEVLAEAVRLVIKLHDPERSPALEAEVKNWQNADPAHARAFERMTYVWEFTSHLRPEHLPQQLQSEYSKPVRRRRVQTRHVAIIGVVGCLLAVGFAKLFTPARAAQYLETRVGEQRAEILADSSIIRLNTNTRLTVDLRSRKRLIVLERGEAEFAVTQDPNRPFVVTVDQDHFTAVGTSFAVRRDQNKSTVVVTEGKVSVDVAPGVYVTQENPHLEKGGVVLEEGQRIVLVPGHKPVIDRPDPSTLFGWGWQAKRVVFERAPLVDVAAELSRYSKVPVVIHDPDVKRTLLSARYQMQDVSKFVDDVARVLQLKWVRKKDYILIFRPAPKAVAAPRGMDTPARQSSTDSLPHAASSQ